MAVRILMVAGSQAVLELAKSATASVQWCDLITVKDGNDARKLVQTQKFDGMMVADRIPQFDTFELIQQLKN